MDEKEGFGDKAGSEKNTRTSQIDVAVTANRVFRQRSVYFLVMQILLSKLTHVFI